ncbi:MAG: metallophosphoesterase family protein, partial [Oryzihumus sp.]
MRLIHTSDWHLGRSFHRVGLLDAQAAFVDHLVEVVRVERVDAVLVSGDVYDRALPAPETVALLSEAVTRLIDAGAQVVLSSGNHDSAIRLGFAAELLERAGLHIRTGLSSIGRPVLVGDVAVHPRTFAGVDYVALGHLHGRQRVEESVRYSGSPLALSFSEARHTKGS